MNDEEKIKDLEEQLKNALAMNESSRREKEYPKVNTGYNIRTDQVDWINKHAVDNHRWGNKSAFVRNLIDKAMAESGDLY